MRSKSLAAALDIIGEPRQQARGLQAGVHILLRRNVHGRREELVSRCLNKPKAFRGHPSREEILGIPARPNKVFDPSRPEAGLQGAASTAQR